MKYNFFASSVKWTRSIEPSVISKRLTIFVTAVSRTLFPHDLLTLLSVRRFFHAEEQTFPLRLLTGTDGKAPSKRAVAGADAFQEGTADEKRLRRMAMSIRVSFFSEVVKFSVEEGGASVGEQRLGVTVASVTVGLGTHLCWIPVKHKEDERTNNVLRG